MRSTIGLWRTSLPWIITNKLINEDDDQGSRQAAALYRATHQIMQTYQFVFKLGHRDKVNFIKMHGAVYAPECYTNIGVAAMSKLRAAHRYLYMKILQWNGYCNNTEVGADSTGDSSEISLGSTDTVDEFDARSRWLYASIASTFKELPGWTIQHPSPTIAMQLRQARYRIITVSHELALDIDIHSLRSSIEIRRTHQSTIKGRPACTGQC